MHVRPAAHAFPQAPQWLASLDVVTHAPLHMVKPSAHPFTQLPATHARVSPLPTGGHVAQLGPQWSGSSFVA
jgi:hypothetical protein